MTSGLRTTGETVPEASSSVLRPTSDAPGIDEEQGVSTIPGVGDDGGQFNDDEVVDAPPNDRIVDPAREMKASEIQKLFFDATFSRG